MRCAKDAFKRVKITRFFIKGVVLTLRTETTRTEV